MTESFINNLNLFDFSDKEHLITYAEEGFSPLSQRLNILGFEKDEIIHIADYVNEKDSYHCLLPELAPEARIP